MISNKDRSQDPHDGCSASKAHSVRTVVKEEMLKREVMQIERKKFILQLKENARGSFIRIIEETGGHRNSVILPSAGIEGFRSVLDSLAKTASERASAERKFGGSGCR